MIIFLLFAAFSADAAVGESCKQIKNKPLKKMLESNKVRTVSSTVVGGSTFPMPCNGHFIKPTSHGVGGALYVSLARHCIDEKSEKIKIVRGGKSIDLSWAKKDFVFHYDAKFDLATQFEIGDGSNDDRAIVMVSPAAIKNNQGFFKGATSIARCSDSVRKKAIAKGEKMVASGTTNPPFDGKDSSCRAVEVKPISNSQGAKGNPLFFSGFYQMGFSGKAGAIGGLCKGDSGSPIYYQNQKGEICSFGSLFSNSLNISTLKNKPPEIDKSNTPDYSTTKCGTRGQFSYYTEAQFAKKLKDIKVKYESGGGGTSAKKTGAR